MKREDTEDALKLANEHWAWLQTLLEKVYIDAFIHGYGHRTKKKRRRAKKKLT